MRSFVHPVAWIAALSAVLCASAPARADGGALHLAVRGELDAAAIRDALAHDTRRPVTLDAGSTGDERITISLEASGEIAVSFESSRGTVTRSIPAPQSPEAAVNDASLLAASLTIGIDLPEPPPPPIAPPPPITPPPAPLTITTSAPPAIIPDRTPMTFPVSASFFYPLAANFGRPDARTFFDINVLYGRYGRIDGAQVGVVDATDELRGIQIGGIAAHTTKRAEGVQIGGLFTSAGELEGLQIGTVNRSGGDVDGAQIGLVNVASGRVRGTQIGLINVADDIEGLPIGLVSVTKSGGVHPITWASTTTFGNLGLKLATRHTYTLFSASASYAYSRDVYGGGVALGGHVPVTKLFYMDFDAGLTALAAPRTTLSSTGVYNEVLFYPKVRAIAGLRFDKHFSIFGGAGAAVEARIYDGGRDLAVSLMPDLFAGVEL
jgi:hypothetical protein